MILPDHLAPLPVAPRDAEDAGATPMEDFVTAIDVRRVLLGTCGDLPVEGLSPSDFDSFAGRADLSVPTARQGSPATEGPVANAPEKLRLPPSASESPAIHPALKRPDSAPRRAAPPQITPADCEASFGTRRKSERSWVIGMGVALAAILITATLVDFISREAIRRSRATAPLDVIHVIPGQNPAEPGEQDPASLAAKLERERAE